MGKQSDELIQMLISSLSESLGVLTHLSDAELDDPSEHACAMGGPVRDLLTHNIDHEQMHAGQVYSLRYGMRKMQKNQVDRFMAETIRARANLIAALVGLDDMDIPIYFCGPDSIGLRSMVLFEPNLIARRNVSFL